MGFTPEQIGKMSLYQYAACIDGWNASQGGDGDAAPSPEEFRAAKLAHGDLVDEG